MVNGQDKFYYFLLTLFIVLVSWSGFRSSVSRREIRIENTKTLTPVDMEQNQQGGMPENTDEAPKTLLPVEPESMSVTNSERARSTKSSSTLSICILFFYLLLIFSLPLTSVYETFSSKESLFYMDFYKIVLFIIISFPFAASYFIHLTHEVSVSDMGQPPATTFVCFFYLFFEMNRRVAIMARRDWLR